MERLGLPAVRIPLDEQGNGIEVDEPYILIVPLTGRERRCGWRSALTGNSLCERRHNRALLGGVIASGNRDIW
ncbi:class Ib ribonucleoside-diphosphate reductase assembly flavoprotein NrdI [Shigella flexneri]